MANAPPSPSPRPALHQMEADEEDENVKQLNECSTLYLALQECLFRTDRNWKSCQPEVLALKACHSRKNSGEVK
ncbi:hypothetical protein AXF42_Ash000686 [Apostasia shenzhenica]|uniref:CHCH domain-containing protein n=1 Tax=Apostasia shenzhenica TaxID=1088818 RepID=A0A2I0AH13_9ASPA|nr:hypothetical protein AXF42_Ash000686 [Apostasia shenzhenica]